MHITRDCLEVKRIYWREMCNGMMAWSTERAWEENIVCGFNWLEWGGNEIVIG